jgi:hypothetical protein
VQTRWLPLFVGVMQQRQTPNPQAMVFSSETSQSILFFVAMWATVFIIWSGPQQ